MSRIFYLHCRLPGCRLGLSPRHHLRHLPPFSPTLRQSDNISSPSSIYQRLLPPSRARFSSSPFPSAVAASSSSSSLSSSTSGSPPPTSTSTSTLTSTVTSTATSTAPSSLPTPTSTSRPISNTASPPVSEVEKPDYLDPAESAIWDRLVAAFAPSDLHVRDVSGGCGSMYSIDITSARFRDAAVLQQQRMVNKVLGDMVAGWHGVQLRTRVP